MLHESLANGEQSSPECRRLRVKCDERPPSCGQCLKSNRVCHLQDSVFKQHAFSLENPPVNATRRESSRQHEQTAASTPLSTAAGALRNTANRSLLPKPCRNTTIQCQLLTHEDSNTTTEDVQPGESCLDVPATHLELSYPHQGVSRLLFDRVPINSPLTEPPLLEDDATNLLGFDSLTDHASSGLCGTTTSPQGT